MAPVLPRPTRILSLQLFLTGVNRSKSATSLSDFGHTWDQSFSPETRSDHVFVCVHSHWTSEFVSRAVLSRSTYTQLMLQHVFTQSDPKTYSFRKLVTKFFGYWFFFSRSHSKFHFPQFMLKLYGGHIEKIVHYFLRLYFLMNRWFCSRLFTGFLKQWNPRIA